MGEIFGSCPFLLYERIENSTINQVLMLLSDKQYPRTLYLGFLGCNGAMVLGNKIEYGSYDLDNSDSDLINLNVSGKKRSISTSDQVNSSPSTIPFLFNLF